MRRTVSQKKCVTLKAATYCKPEKVCDTERKTLKARAKSGQVSDFYSKYGLFIKYWSIDALDIVTGGALNEKK